MEGRQALPSGIRSLSDRADDKTERGTRARQPGQRPARTGASSRPVMGTCCTREIWAVLESHWATIREASQRHTRLLLTVRGLGGSTVVSRRPPVPQ